MSHEIFLWLTSPARPSLCLPGLLSLFPPFSAMSDQQRLQEDIQGQQPEEDNQVEQQQQYDGHVVLPPPPHMLYLLHITAILARITYNEVMNHFAPLYLRIPYHTSPYTGQHWINDLLTGHPKRIQYELGVSRGTFNVLLKAMQTLGHQSSCHISIEEQLSIFLYTAVTGLSCIHVGERFQGSPTTITK